MSSISSFGVAFTASPGLDPSFFGTALSQQRTPDKLSGATDSTPRPAPAKSPTNDQVDVSKAAEARLLRSQGASLGEIEATLGVGESTVTSYLGITDGTETLEAAAAAALEAGGIS